MCTSSCWYIASILHKLYVLEYCYSVYMALYTFVGLWPEITTRGRQLFQQQVESGRVFLSKFTVLVWMKSSSRSSRARIRRIASSKADATLVASFALVSKYGCPPFSLHHRLASSPETWRSATSSLFPTTTKGKLSGSFKSA